MPYYCCDVKQGCNLEDYPYTPYSTLVENPYRSLQGALKKKELLSLGSAPQVNVDELGSQFVGAVHKHVIWISYLIGLHE